MVQFSNRERTLNFNREINVIFNNVCFEGVLTQETDRNVTTFGIQYVAATYVKFIESAGGRMVPILYPF